MPEKLQFLLRLFPVRTMRRDLCSELLCLISLCVAVTVQSVGSAGRFARSSGSAPAPVDCQLGQWSQWSPCFPCQGSKHRYRALAQPAKYDGRICIGNLWESMICKSSEKCVPDNKCGSDFQCEETGRCIKRQLVCNGETDCRDESDERDCEPQEDERFCRQLFPIPGAERAVRGFNILTQEEAQNVLDHRYFGGQCEYIYNGEWRELRYDPTCEQMYYAADEKYFRKPYNFHVYQFLARADTGMSYEVYDDSKDLLNAIRKESSSASGFSFNIKAAESPVGVEFGINSESKSDFLKNISSYTQKNLQFVRFLTEVQTARFRIRRNSLVLDEDLLMSLMELPDTYSYGLYAKFITDYGTHFVTSGTMGGIMDNVLVLDKEVMKKQDVTYSMLYDCFGGYISGTGVSDDGQVEGSFKIQKKNCERLESKFTERHGSESVIKDIITHIKGGDTGSAGGLLNVIRGDTYRYWGRSLKYNPAVINFELQPIHEGLQLTGLSGIEMRRQNLKRAYDDFLIEFNSCRCGPCHNNGEPILDNNVCSCLCPAGYEGPSCEQTSRPDIKAKGGWSCWSSWSTCQSGKRQRTRSCNNPPPKNGGSRCLGKSVQTESC
ncbi:complement component C8 alpha chain [Bufo gargarizans]|uniref:complement component C8 alpha chain n=1 Tax=Bufo gargarizans TaxID=30331 RepID=UPI001CF30522|nr:complement component C8 alpha chain [Bufo gargarizans]